MKEEERLLESIEEIQQAVYFLNETRVALSDLSKYSSRISESLTEVNTKFDSVTSISELFQEAQDHFKTVRNVFTPELIDSLKSKNENLTRIMEDFRSKIYDLLAELKYNIRIIDPMAKDYSELIEDFDGKLKSLSVPIKDGASITRNAKALMKKIQNFSKNLEKLREEFMNSISVEAIRLDIEAFHKEIEQIYNNIVEVKEEQRNYMEALPTVNEDLKEVQQEIDRVFQVQREMNRSLENVKVMTAEMSHVRETSEKAFTAITDKVKYLPGRAYKGWLITIVFLQLLIIAIQFVPTLREYAFSVISYLK